MAVRDGLRILKNASWLGWQMESNWTDPFLFAVYSLVKPIAATLLLVVMYIVVTMGQVKGTFFAYMYVGNAFYMYVAQVLFGVSWVVHEDREHYQTLKYVYISPANIYIYLFGRGITKIFLTTISVIITIAFGILALNIPINLMTIDYPLLFVSFIIGLLCIVGLGIALGGISLLTAKHSGFINEGVAGIFYLFCGVIFPIAVLPNWCHSFSLCLPITYWLEAIRRAIFGTTIDQATNFIPISSVLFILTISTIFFFILALDIFKLGDHFARKKGLIDMTTAY